MLLEHAMVRFVLQEGQRLSKLMSLRALEDLACQQ